MGDSSRNSTSKVKVEYTDPSGVYPKVAEELNSRLPLRNLNWNSSTRPLRSIDSLFVELVADEKTTQELDRSASQDGVAGGPRSSEQASQRGRRHQIPGLRSTPYLKIYLLRCDDSETYKTTSRKLIREWIKSHGSSSQGKGPSNQENHDAFEWLIVHIAPVEGASWPTKSSASVLEKVKSDFNSSSKSFDRVTQIPCAFDIPGGNPAEAVPPGPPRERFLRDSDVGWVDLLMKFKALILASFDSRVGQYEEDIKEKGSQRNIPGWNFCTFFVLKEGLARGFESVGLLEDALMGYDELSVELLSAMESEEEKGRAGEVTSLFQDHTKELNDHAEASLKGSESVSISAMNLDADKKPYRELILANDISIFDFRSYVFARQVSVLLRIASLSEPPSIPGVMRPSTEPAALAEVCSRASSFITSNSRTARQDLRSSFMPQQLTNATLRAAKHNVVENIVASWSYSVAQQILEQTDDPTLEREMDAASRSSVKSPPLKLSTPQPDAKSPQPAGLPARSSSFANRPQSVSLQQGSDGFTEESIGSRPVPAQKRTSLLRLASQRAELYMLCRRAINNMAERIDWHTGWRNFSISDISDSMDDVSLEDDSSESKEDELSTSASAESSFKASILGESLKHAMSTRGSFHECFEDLSWSAHNLYKYSGDEKSLHAMIADIANLRFQLKDYNVAASYFHQLAPFYAEQNWSELELAILDLYARCLKQLGKSEEYVRIGLKLLAKIASARHSNTQEHKRNSVQGSIDLLSHAVSFGDHIGSILSASEKLNEPCSVHLRNYFLEVTINQNIEHLDDSDGFALGVSLRHIMSELFDAEFKVKLSSVSEGHTREIWLSSRGPVKLQPGKVLARVISNTLIPDKYVVERLVIQAQKVTFQHDYITIDGGNRPGSRDSASQGHVNIPKDPIIVWPSRRNFKVTVTALSDMHLDQPKAVLLTLTAGDRSASNIRLQIKPGTAGLRMYTSDAQLASGDQSILDKSQPGVIILKELESGVSVKISIPYQMDTEFKQISLRSEATYVISQREFVYGDNHKISVLLPLGVNVQDIFQSAALYSKFSISCSTAAPISILKYDMTSTKHFDAVTHGGDDERISVFTKQPLSLVYRITRKVDKLPHQGLETRLSMRIEYQCLDAEIAAAVQDCLTRSLNGSEFKYLEPLLISHITETLLDKLPRQDLEFIGLLREIGLAPYTEFRWDDILTALPNDTRLSVVEWLEQWHKNNQTIVLPTIGSSALIRRVTIPVDVPPMHIIHTARLRLLSSNDTVDFSLNSPIAVGEAVAAELTIKHTRAWAQSDIEGGKPLSFCYELDASPDTWLIGGRRRATFTAREGEEQKFAVLLLPQRSGQLLLPTLELSYIEEPDELGQEQTHESQWSCEVDNLSQGQAILVVPNLKSTTVSMDFEGGQAWLVDAEGIKAS